MTTSEVGPGPIGDIDLSSPDFWSLPARVRDQTFEKLRTEAPLSRHQAPEDILGVGERDDRPYWAIVRHEDVRTISRDPETFCSGEGVQFGDAPKEMLEASQSFLAMDAPRHTKLRKLVSSAFTPRQVARSARDGPRPGRPGRPRAARGAGHRAVDAHRVRQEARR